MLDVAYRDRSARADLLQSRKNGGKTSCRAGRAAKGRLSMRIPVILVCGALAACTQRRGDRPERRRDHRGAAGRHRLELRPAATTSPARSRRSLGRPPTACRRRPARRWPSPDGTGAALDDDRINLMQWTLEQQKIDAAIAERDLDCGAQPARRGAARAAAEPRRTASTSRSSPSRRTNAVGQSVYPRSVGARVPGVGSCGRFRDADAAQRAFLAGGGPAARPLRPRPGRRRLRLPAGTRRPTARSTELVALGWSCGR